MRLDIVYLSRQGAGLAVGIAEHGFLGRFAGRGQTVRSSILIDRASSNDREDRITVGQGQRERLEHNSAGPLAPNITIGPRIESSAPAVGGEKPDFGEVFDHLG